MLKYMLGGVVLLLTGLVCAQDETIPPPETANLQLTDAAIYDFCEQLSADKYPQNLMNMDLNFNRIHYYAVSMLTDDSHAEAKIACLKQKRLEMRHYALQKLKQNSGNNQYLQADYFKYLVRIKSPYVKKLLLNSFEQKTTSATEQESIVDYLLYYQTFYIKDNDGYVNLREKPSATSNSVKKLTNGTQITLINYHNNWWHVLLDNGQQGYIYADRITDKQ